MKRILIALCLLGCLASGLLAEESAFYPVRLNVLKIYSHAEGFRVLYQKGNTSTAELYIPIRWFKAGGKAELVRGEDQSYPYLVAFFTQGKFSHLRLYAPASIQDQAWGILAPEAGKGKFEAEDIKLEL